MRKNAAGRLMNEVNAFMNFSLDSFGKTGMDGRPPGGILDASKYLTTSELVTLVDRLAQKRDNNFRFGQYGMAQLNDRQMAYVKDYLRSIGVGGTNDRRITMAETERGPVPLHITAGFRKKKDCRHFDLQPVYKGRHHVCWRCAGCGTKVGMTDPNIEHFTAPGRPLVRSRHAKSSSEELPVTEDVRAEVVAIMYDQMQGRLVQPVERLMVTHAVSQWWDSLSTTQKQKYAVKHPGSSRSTSALRLGRQSHARVSAASELYALDRQLTSLTARMQQLESQAKTEQKRLKAAAQRGETLAGADVASRQLSKMQATAAAIRQRQQELRSKMRFMR